MLSYDVNAYADRVNRIRSRSSAKFCSNVRTNISRTRESTRVRLCFSTCGCYEPELLGILTCSRGVLLEWRERERVTAMDETRAVDSEMNEAKKKEAAVRRTLKA